MNALHFFCAATDDFTQLDKIYVLGKIILDGSSQLVFIGIAEQKQRLAAGLMLAVIYAIKAIFDDPDVIFNKVSSVCTDGANINTGNKNSLWTLLEEELRRAGSKICLTKFGAQLIEPN